MSIRFRCKCGREFEVPDRLAGKHATCKDCGRQLTIPRRHRTPGPSARPDQPPPARPAPPQDDVPVARLVEEPVPEARAVQAPATPARPAHARLRRRPSLAPVQIAMGIATLVMIVIAIDAVIALRGAVRGGIKGVGAYHTLWLLFLVVGFFVAAAGAKGSRLCIGILIGGALRNLFVNGPGILVASQLGVVKDLSPDLAKILMLVGGAALGLGAIYVVLFLAAGGVRKHLSGHGGVVIGGAVGGFLFGGFVALTAMPEPGLVFTRIISHPRTRVAVAQAIDAPELIGAGGKKNIRVEVRSNLSAVNSALETYIAKNMQWLPEDLGEIVNEDCPAKCFVCPGTGKAPPERDKKTGRFTGPIDIEFLFPGWHRRDLPGANRADELRQLVICHSDPNCHFGEGAVVMRFGLPGEDYRLVEYLPKDRLDEELSDTRKWIRRHEKARRPSRKVLEKGDLEPYRDDE